MSISDDIGESLATLREDGPAAMVQLVIGIVIAFVVQIVSGILMTMLFVGSGGSLTPALLFVPSVLGSVFIMVAIGSAARTTIAMEDGGETRRRGWATVPTGVLMLGLGALFSALFPPIAIPVGVLVQWLYVYAMLDVVARDSSIGITGGLEVIRTAPMRAFVPLLVMAPILAGLLLTPVPALLVGVIGVYGTFLLAMPVYRSVHAFEPVSTGMEQQQRDDVATTAAGRDLPSYLVASSDPDGATVTATAQVPAAAPEPVQAIGGWQATTLSLDVNGARGAWFTPTSAGRTVEVSVGSHPVGSVMCCDSAGNWYHLAARDATTWHAALPTDGPWYIVVDTPADELMVHCRVTASAPGSEQVAA